MKEYKVLVAFGRHEVGDTFKMRQTQCAYLERKADGKVDVMFMDLETDPRVELIGEEE